MNWIDIVILTVLTGAAIMGLRTGVVRWAAMIIGAIVAAIVSSRAYGSVAPVFTFLDNESQQRTLAFIAIFIAVMVGAWLAGNLLKKSMSLLLLGWIDRLGGLALGLIAGVISTVTFVTLLGILPSESLQDSVADSALAAPLLEATSFFRAFLPVEFDDIKEVLDKTTELVQSGAGEG
ncbi:MAG: CvpA family protein [Chloroflexota bacterium]|nr:CvpA family protein [Chloroflexota bacterium]